MLDLLIRGCRVIDGSGEPSFISDVAVMGDRIVLINKNIDREALRTIQADGLCLAPGFVDAHSHSDFPLLIDRRAESKVRQGVTSEVIGNCGSSPAPMLGAAREEALTDNAAYGLNIDWEDMGGYIRRINEGGVGLNVVPLVGHNTVRAAVMGFDDLQPTPEQQAAMERIVEDAILQGAHGLSTGLFYPPGLYAKTEEVIGLAKAAARAGGVYASHIRSESDGLMDAVVEAIRIGREADIPVEISHVKLEGYRNFDGLEQLETLIKDAYLSGQAIGCDQYPYTACSTWLAAILPNWAQAGGVKAVAERLRDPKIRADLRKDWETNPADWENRAGVARWEDILITDCRTNHNLEGVNVAEAARQAGKDAFEFALDLIAETGGGVSCVYFDQDEDNVRALMKNPLVVVGSDGYSLSPEGPLGAGKPHPRSYGTFPRVLGHYVREEKVLTLEEAVRKMTSITAQRFGLTGRGLVTEGAFADLVLFDAATINDQATFTNPHQFPTGIPYVIVNGKVVIDQGKHTGLLPGHVI
jgi:N-acyl-D-amino-acid deacylase